jgi:hypothetical protein
MDGKYSDHNGMSSFEIIVKFCVVLVPVFKSCEDKVFRYIGTFLSPIRKTAQNFEKRVLELLFTPVSL